MDEIGKPLVLKRGAQPDAAQGSERPGSDQGRDSTEDTKPGQAAPITV